MLIELDTSRIDFELLRRQKKELLRTPSDEDLSGLIGLLDYIQDEAAQVLGEEEVFGDLL